MKLLLISNSTQHGSGYLAHCEDETRNFLRDLQVIVFIPYAIHDWDAYTKVARRRFKAWGLQLIGIHEQGDPKATLAKGDAIFTGGGNSFRLLNLLYEQDLMAPIREKVKRGAPYIGTSAGSNVACVSIRTTNDMPIVYPPSFDALDLVPFNINPHYLDPDPDSTHGGETREQRIAEFHEMNDCPVVGLREGSMLHVEDSHITLKGITPARLFRRGESPEEFQPGSDMSFLLT